MDIHPKARPLISELRIPSPLTKYFPKDLWEIDLSENRNPYMDDFASYPDVLHEDLKALYLKTLLSHNCPASYNKNSPSHLTGKNILFTAGLMEGFDLVIRTFSEPNKDNICVISPTFPAYAHWGHIHNVNVFEIPFEGDNFSSLAIENIIQLNPALVFLCNPNNPTGTVLNPEHIEKLCSALEGFLVVDEAYIEFSDTPSSLFLLQQHSNLIVLRTLSKAWGMAGIRCGAILSHELVINSLRYVQLPFSFSCLAQKEVRKRLVDHEKVYRSWKYTRQEREKLERALSTLSIVSKVFKSATNFLMIKLKDHKKTLNTLKENKIQVMDCSDQIPSSIRVSLGTEKENNKSLEIMKKL